MSRMAIYYNSVGIGDVLLISLKQGNRETTDFRKFGDVVEIYDTESNQINGYNIFNSSTYIELSDGKHELTEELQTEINQIFTKNNAPNQLDVDLSPKFVVGYVKSKEKHQNADKLSVCQVDLGDETVQIVCGAANVDAGQHVVVAKVGAIMPSGMEIKAAKLRDVDSFGMICSQKELGLPNAPEEKGIYVLSGDVEAGQPFNF